MVFFGLFFFFHHVAAVRCMSVHDDADIELQGENMRWKYDPSDFNGTVPDTLLGFIQQYEDVTQNGAQK